MASCCGLRRRSDYAFAFRPPRFDPQAEAPVSGLRTPRNGGTRTLRAGLAGAEVRAASILVSEKICDIRRLPSKEDPGETGNESCASANSVWPQCCQPPKSFSEQGGGHGGGFFRPGWERSSQPGQNLGALPWPFAWFSWPPPPTTESCNLSRSIPTPKTTKCRGHVKIQRICSLENRPPLSAAGLGALLPTRHVPSLWGPRSTVGAIVAQGRRGQAPNAPIVRKAALPKDVRRGRLVLSKCLADKGFYILLRNWKKDG